MIGVNSSGIFGQKSKSLALEQKPNVSELEILKRTVNDMKEFIQNQENSNLTHRKELIELISGITKSCENAVSQKIEESLNKKLDQPPEISNDEKVTKVQEISKIEKPKKSKKKFAPICESIYNEVLSSRPDIACVDKSTLFIGEDNNVYHKSGIKYNLVDALYLCKIAKSNK